MRREVAVCQQLCHVLQPLSFTVGTTMLVYTTLACCSACSFSGVGGHVPNLLLTIQLAR
jgi:hypothetical protein